MQNEEKHKEKKRRSHHGELNNYLWEDQMDFGGENPSYYEDVRYGEFERKTRYSSADEYGENIGNDLISDPLQVPYRPDEKIRGEVMEALYKDMGFDASKIEVDVSEGNVYLRGSVNSREEKKAAESCAERISGVEDIFNELKIKKKDFSATLS